MGELNSSQISSTCDLNHNPENFGLTFFERYLNLQFASCLTGIYVLFFFLFLHSFLLGIFTKTPLKSYFEDVK